MPLRILQDGDLQGKRRDCGAVSCAETVRSAMGLGDERTRMVSNPSTCVGIGHIFLPVSSPNSSDSLLNPSDNLLGQEK
jgi:hypothetical protein